MHKKLFDSMPDALIIGYMWKTSTGNCFLREAATVSSGVTFRSRIEPDSRGDIRVIQMKDIAKNGSLNLQSVFRVKNRFPALKNFLTKGDIIFRSQGYEPTATLIDFEIENTVASSPLFRITADREKVLPEYLFWYLNQPQTQSRLAMLAMGTTVLGIRIKDLGELEISLPPMELQEAIGNVYALSLREQEILELIKRKRNNYIHKVLEKIAEGGRNGQPH